MLSSYANPERSMHSLFMQIPSVDSCLHELEKRFPSASRGALLAHCRSCLNELRLCIKNGMLSNLTQLSHEETISQIAASFAQKEKPRLRRVINGAGVVVHTNLGRSVLAHEAILAVQEAASGYCSLEFDISTGERGSRMNLVEELICTLTGAEAALVVNNNAAAVMLMLDTLCKGGEAIISRGQLVEIGGSFRIPDVMELAGACLAEVGTTNRTHLADYENAITENTRAILWVHPSNFRVIGFHSSVPPRELSTLAHANGLPMLGDLGSGSLLDFSDYGLQGEPTVQETLRSGIDIVTFSGDKVLGGPQAGIIAGKKALIDKMKGNQLLRALRCDKLTLAALEATLRLYFDETTARQYIPTVRMICTSYSILHERAELLAGQLSATLGSLACCSVHEDFSRVGGGAFPEQGLPTALVCIAPTSCSASVLKKRLLSAEPPLVGRLAGKHFEIDVRTIDVEDFSEITRIMEQALQQPV